MDHKIQTLPHVPHVSPDLGPANTQAGALFRTLDDEAKNQGWVIIRIRNDWRKIFAFE